MAEKDMDEESRTKALITIPEHRDSAEQTKTTTWCMSKINGVLTEEIRQEVRKIIALAGPAFLYQVMVFMISIVSAVFCGHLGKVELDAVVLAIAVVNITGVAVGTGLAGACDTLISQIYGGRNLKLVGTILQRGILILMLSCFPCWALFVNTEPILRLFRQDPDVSRLTQVYVLIFIPALPASFLYQLQARYLQNQGIILPQVLTGLMANIFNVIINYVFLHLLGLGVMGSACANTLSQCVQALLLFCYIICRKLHVETWGGWSSACFDDWGPFIRLAIPSMLMLCIEWWAFEVGIILAGMLSVEDLGAQSIVYQMANLIYMVPMGFSIAACVRVGHSLGSGDIAQAKKSMMVVLVITETCALACCLLLVSLKGIIAYIYTKDKEIVSLVSYVLPVYAVSHLFDGCVATCGGVLRGTGKQKIGAIFHAVGYYIICIPVAIALMFAAKIGIIGFWIGALLCSFLQFIALLIFVFRIDWVKASEEAQARVKQKQRVAHIAQSEAEAYESRPETADPDETKMEMLAEKKEPNQSSEHLENEEAPNVRKALSKRELILRRSLALITAVTVLMIGILIRLCV